MKQFNQGGTFNQIVKRNMQQKRKKMNFEI